MNKATSPSKKFVLTRKNQKGQVAIFVALIFQVVFVFFALLINVGLLVHHKINLQQSTDLAAYYGAMKQAEMLNAISHVNFQIRQSWKLLTWRYRVLGTFGFQGETKLGANNQHFPFEAIAKPTPQFSYNAEVNTKCGGTGDPDIDGNGVQDIPFFCVGHGGFKGWKSPADTACRVSCDTFKLAKSVNSIPTIGPVTLPFNGVGAVPIDNLINGVNDNLKDLCNNLGTFGGGMLARFVAAYEIDTSKRKALIEMLAKDLSSVDFVDVDGGKVADGVRTTLKHNLTEANAFKIGTITTHNGLSDDNCSFKNGKSNNEKEFLKKIEFEFINYFIHQCKDNGNGDARQFLYEPKPLYTDQNKVDVRAFQKLDQNIINVLESVFNDNQKHTIGYEKNPNCIEYYAVKASATPLIPFLPISAVKLNAISVFKPFGGSVGPWFGNKWEAGNSNSTFQDNDEKSKTDRTMPYRKPPSATGLSQLKESIKQQPNFSLFVGDTAGLSDSRYLAAYHSMLAKRDSPLNIPGFDNDKNDIDKLSPGKFWPAYTDWDGVDKDLNSLAYDPLAKKTSGVRALEISAIAPNQFDLAYYSIDPDFYNNYFVKLYKNFDAIKAVTGTMGPASKGDLRADYGAKVDSSIVSQNVNRPAMDVATFSVKDQILLKNLLFDVAPTVKTPHGPNGKYNDHFPFLANLQASILTGWTFVNFSDYMTFPKEDLSPSTTMSFGKCDNTWNNSTGSTTGASNFANPNEPGTPRPPTPGNCVTGGRTGYSVKMVSPAMIMNPPPGQGLDPIQNPLPADFLVFSN